MAQCAAMEDLESPRLRQKAHEDWIISSSLEPLHHGFQDSDFQAVLQTFVADHAQDFAAVWPDGSHPLLWNMLHGEYKGMFEEQLERTLAAEGMTKESFEGAVHHLEEVQRSLGDHAENLNGFLKNLMAADDYHAFLQIMFSEVQRTPIPSSDEHPSNGYSFDHGYAIPDHESQTIEVIVPEGVLPGGVAAVEHMGRGYQIMIPDGYSPGMSFHQAVAVPLPQ